jgi:sn-glycerol 3-phosphate transport system ATP-binding protein
MNGGRMDQFGTPDEVYHHPATTFVASFIGSPPMNLLHKAPGVKPGAILGVRPEHLHIGPNGWEASVDTVEMLGAERLVYARVGEESLIVRIPEDHPAPVPGDMIHLSLQEDRVHWFDLETGKRL